MSVKMKALRQFSNPKIEDGGARGDGSVLIGETFTTDWLHARDLKQGGLAEPVTPADLDKEPTEAIEATSALSRAAHAAVNERRAKARTTGATGATGGTGATGAAGK